MLSPGSVGICFLAQITMHFAIRKLGHIRTQCKAMSLENIVLQLICIKTKSTLIHSRWVIWALANNSQFVYNTLKHNIRIENRLESKLTSNTQQPEQQQNTIT